MEIDFSVRLMGISGESDEMSEDITLCMRKLIDICKNVAELMEGYILDIYVLPMSIFRKTTDEIKHLGFYVVYNRFYENLTGEDLNEKCETYLKLYAESEFDGVEDVKVTICKDTKWSEPTFLLYSAETEDVKYSDLSKKEQSSFKAICDAGYNISIPKTFKLAKRKTIIFHTSDLQHYIEFLTFINSGDSDVSLDLVEDISAEGSKSAYVYAISLRKNGFQFDVPYTFIDASYFVEENSEDKEISSEEK